MSDYIFSFLEKDSDARGVLISQNNKKLLFYIAETVFAEWDVNPDDAGEILKDLGVRYFELSDFDNNSRQKAIFDTYNKYYRDSLEETVDEMK